MKCVDVVVVVDMPPGSTPERMEAVLASIVATTDGSRKLVVVDRSSGAVRAAGCGAARRPRGPRTAPGVQEPSVPGARRRIRGAALWDALRDAALRHGRSTAVRIAPGRRRTAVLQRGSGSRDAAGVGWPAAAGQPRADTSPARSASLPGGPAPLVRIAPQRGPGVHPRVPLRRSASRRRWWFAGTGIKALAARGYLPWRSVGRSGLPPSALFALTLRGVRLPLERAPAIRGRALMNARRSGCDDRPES